MFGLVLDYQKLIATKVILIRLNEVLSEITVSTSLLGPLYLRSYTRHWSPLVVREQDVYSLATNGVVCGELSDS